MLKNITKSGPLKIILVGFLVLIYVFLSLQHSNNVNINMESNDQSAYMSAVKLIHTNNFWYLGDRGRMPLYPYIQAIFYKPGMSDADLFQKGKIINILLSLICLGVIYSVVSRYLNFTTRIVFLLITSFAFFLFKAAYFQTEILFYTLNFLSFIWFLKTLSSHNYKTATIAGLLTALSYSAKATALLGLIIFILFELTILIWKLLKHKKFTNLKRNLMTSSRLFRVGFPSKRGRHIRVQFIQGLLPKVFLKSVISTSLLVLVFLTTLSPYLLENKRLFGKYFYNVATDFYTWYDSWSEVVEGTRAHGDRVGWPNLPNDQIPSLNKYIKEHSFWQILSRQISGMSVFVYTITLSYPAIAFSYLLLFFIFLALIPPNRKIFILRIVKKNHFFLPL